MSRHTMQCTSPISVVSQHKLVSGRGLWKWRSAPSYAPMWLGKDFTYVYICLRFTLLRYKCEWVSEQSWIACLCNTQFLSCLFHTLFQRQDLTYLHVLLYSQIRLDPYIYLRVASFRNSDSTSYQGSHFTSWKKLSFDLQLTSQFCPHCLDTNRNRTTASPVWRPFIRYCPSEPVPQR